MQIRFGMRLTEFIMLKYIPCNGFFVVKIIKIMVGIKVIDIIEICDRVHSLSHAPFILDCGRYASCTRYKTWLTSTVSQRSISRGPYFNLVVTELSALLLFSWLETPRHLLVLLLKMLAFNSKSSWCHYLTATTSIGVIVPPPPPQWKLIFARTLVVLCVTSTSILMTTKGFESKWWCRFVSIHLMRMCFSRDYFITDKNKKWKNQIWGWLVFQFFVI